jgi:hypothetical protein
VGQMRGSLRWRSSEPLPPEWSGEPRPRKNTPGGGLAVLRALDDSDDYWTILDALLFLTTSPGKAGLRVQAGDGHTRANGAACRGPPVVRERSGIVQTLRPIGSGSYRDGEMNSGESDVQKSEKI